MSPLSILLIDDDALVNMINQKMLGINLPEVSTAVFESGLKALDFLIQNGIENTLILLDINMPEMDGWQFLERLIEKQPPTTPMVIMLTSSIDLRDKERALASPLMLDFISKPLTKESIQEKIKPAIMGMTG